MADMDILALSDRAWRTDGCELVPATKVKPEPVRWLWPHWLAMGKLHLLAGSPGTGKTTIAVSLAAAITSGAAWPDDGHAEPGDVLIWSGEDGIADTLLPRFLAAGGDPRRLHFAGDVCESGRSRLFNPATDLSKLIEATRFMRELKLVVLDPVVAVITGDSHKNSETRRDLQPVVSLAEQLDVAVLGITHLSKGSTGRQPLERVMGSIAFAAVARIVLATVKARDPQQPHRLVRAKSNLGPDRGGIEYNLFSAPVPGHDFHAQRIDWGQCLDGSALELMAIEAPDEEAEARSEIQEFLRDLLSDGPKAQREVRAAAEAHGYRWRTVERAKADVGVTTAKGKGEFRSLWYWELPLEPNSATDHEVRHAEHGGGVRGEAAPDPKSATGDEVRHAEHGGGVRGGAAPPSPEAALQIRELEENIARQQELVRTLASAGQSTAEADQLLESMGEALEALKWSLRRPSGH
jgi:hypothetical protein